MMILHHKEIGETEKESGVKNIRQKFSNGLINDTSGSGKMV